MASLRSLEETIFTLTDIVEKRLLTFVVLDPIVGPDEEPEEVESKLGVANFFSCTVII